MNASPCAASYVKREWRNYLKCFKRPRHVHIHARVQASLSSPDCIQFILGLLVQPKRLVMAPVGIKSCSNCQQNNYRRQVCVKCGASHNLLIPPKRLVMYCVISPKLKCMWSRTFFFFLSVWFPSCYILSTAPEHTTYIVQKPADRAKKN